MAGPIDVKGKGGKSIRCFANNVTLIFDHTHGLHHGFSMSNFEIAISGMRGLIDIEYLRCESVIHDYDHDLMVTKVRCKELQDSDWGNFRCRRDAGSSSFPMSINERYPHVS